MGPRYARDSSSPPNEPGAAMLRHTRVAPILFLAVVAAACGAEQDRAPTPDASMLASTEEVAGSAHDTYFANLAALCGRAFRGEAELASGSGFEEEMIMHVRHCDEE